MAGEQWVLTAEICGGLIGLAGGVVGTYFSIKNTCGSKERFFMIKASLVFLIAIIIFLVLLFLLPKPYGLLMWFPYSVFLPLGIIYCNKKQKKIRDEESQDKETFRND